MSAFTDNPPVTRDMLGVLDHGDAIDPSPTFNTFGITPTSLDETLERTVFSRGT